VKIDQKIGIRRYGKGNDARIVIRLRCSSLKSLDRNPLTIYETGFVTLTCEFGGFSSLKDKEAVTKDCKNH
jgi:hypothetical protein